MAAVADSRSAASEDAGGTAAPSPAGPEPAATAIVMPPALPLPRWQQTLRFGFRPLTFSVGTAQRLGEVFRVNLLSRDEPIVVTTHPDHVKSLFTAKPADAPSLTGESPLRPILGPNSVLTAVGERHMRQRKLLLPPFHGDAVARYVRTIEEVTARELDRWEAGSTFALAPRMQAITLDVIMAGIYGVEGRTQPGTIEHTLRQTTRRLLRLSTKPAWQLVELSNLGRDEPRGVLKAVLSIVDRQIHEIIRQRRARPTDASRDVLSLLLEARDDEGRALTDRELRDELMTLVLAGHETTANQLAWTFERLLRTPDAYDRLRETVRGGGDDAAAYVEATIHEGMRARPVIPMIARLVQKPWRLGHYVVPAGTPVAMSIVGVQHREDVYPQPFAFRPERFLDRKPGTYTWIPFGGGIRRCLGATLAMAEQRVVLEAIARRTDLRAADPRPERARQRNVTMIPEHGGRVTVAAVRSR